MAPGTYRNITGNLALAYGLVAAASQSGLAVFLGVLPDHPGLRHPPRAEQAQGVRRARPSRPRTRSRASASAIGAAFAGALGVTTTSGPGSALKSEAIGLAVMTELPLVVVDVQRGGPSHRSADQDRAGRPAAGDVRPQRRGPVPDHRAASPADCFDAAVEATGIAVTYRTPVILLSDGYLANGSEPWQHPRDRDAAGHRPRRSHRAHRTADGGEPSTFRPYTATPRPWPAPGRCPAPPGLEHRIGGLEKADGDGNISYDPDNHDHMVRLRQAKVDKIAGHTRPRSRSTTRRGRRVCWCSAGDPPTAPSASPADAYAEGRLPGGPGPPSPPQPVPLGSR